MSCVTTEAIAEYQNGASVKDVLTKFSISRTHFYRVLKQQTIALRGPLDRYSTTELADIAAKYQSGVTLDELAKRYQSSASTLSAYLKDAGYHIRSTSEVLQIYSESQIQQTINNYINGLSAKASGTWCGASEPSVLRWLKERNIDRRHLPDYGGISDYFSKLDCQTKLYWFGFLCADGNIRQSEMLRVLLSSKDADHLRLFLTIIEYTKPVAIFKKTRHWKDRPAKEYEYALAEIGRIEMVRDLMRHGISRIKTGQTRDLYHLDDEQFRHFLRGYFDGDGSISMPKTRRQLSWYICGQHPEFLEYLLSRCPVAKRWNAIEVKNGENSLWRVSYGGNQIVSAICKWLYKDAEVFLPRKKTLADSFLSTPLTGCGRILF